MRSGVKGNKGNTNSYMAAENPNYKHGMKGTRFFNIWRSMKDRCLNPNSKYYRHYGGRGISVCEKWLRFPGFQKDMFPTYKEDLTIDRVDVNGNYCKENCKWSTRKEQTRNRRNTIHVQVKGRTVLLTDLAEQSGVKYITLYDRIFRQGIPAELAIENKVVTV